MDKQFIMLFFDENGNAVNITFEHAKLTAHLPDFSFQQYEKTA